MSKQSFRDLKNEIELKNAEIYELTMILDEKNEEINKLKLYSTKLKYEKKNLYLQKHSECHCRDAESTRQKPAGVARQGAAERG